MFFSIQTTAHNELTQTRLFFLGERNRFKNKDINELGGFCVIEKKKKNPKCTIDCSMHMLQSFTAGIISETHLDWLKLLRIQKKCAYGSEHQA